MKKQGMIGLRVLAGLLLSATLLTGCQPGSNTDDSTGEDTTTTPYQTEDTTGGGECGTDDPEVKQALLLSQDGVSDYTVVIPSSSATWEREAAQAILDLLRLEGDARVVAEDVGTPLSNKEIVIGYTNRNDRLPEGFFDLGEDGYHICAVDERLFVAANSQAGMTAALAKLREDVHVSGGNVFIEYGYTHRVKDNETDTDTSATLLGTYGPTISYAQQMANGVQAGYSDPTRRGATMTNLNMVLKTDMTARGSCRVAYLNNTCGLPYVTDTMDAYVKLRDGSTFYSNDSDQAGRLNIYRYGSYYYQTHVLGTNFGSARAEDEASGVEPYDILAAAGRDFKGNNAFCGLDRETGHMVMDITAAYDPYVVIGGTYAVPTDTYDAIKLTVKTQSASVAQAYIAAGESGGINGEQSVNFSVSPDGEFYTYIIYLGQVPGYTGNVTQLRLDFDGQKGEKIEISEIKAVKTKPTGIPSLVIDRTLHTYSDKLHHAFQLVATDTVEGLAAYGMVTSVDAYRVNSLLVLDKNGEHTTLEGVDWDSAYCVGFDVANVGVFGYILTAAKNNGTIHVTLSDGRYTIRQEVAAAGSIPAETKIHFGQRIYTDMTHDFEGLCKAAYEERNPLTVTLTSQGTGAHLVGYEPLQGAYRFNVDGTGFNEAFYDDPQAHYRVDARIEGDATDRTVYLYTHTNHGELECAVLMSDGGAVLPVAMQVCKNFMGENEEPIFDKGDMSYGEAYFPLSVRAGESLDFTVLNLYQNWGIFPLKQISSIQFIAPYYHLSTGVTETNCIAPYYVFGKDLWTLPDFRAMSAPMWSAQPQHTSAGQLYFLQYTDEKGDHYGSESTTDRVDSYGPIYADVTMDYVSDDGRIAASYRHLEMPQTDENRTYYEIDLQVLEDISFKNFKEDFSIFSMDGRFGFYDVFSYLDENGQVVKTDTNRGITPTYVKLGGPSPFVAYSYMSGSGDYVNMALILKEWSVTVGGEPYTGNLVFSDRSVTGAGGSLNYGQLSLDLEEVTLKAGDRIRVRMILLPWGSQLLERDNIDSVLQVRQDTCLAPYTATATVGTVVADAYMAKVMSADDVAEFTLSGGENNMAVRVYGLSDYARPTIEELVDGQWVAYNTASVEHGYDGYTVYYDGDGTYSCAFVVSMTDGAPRTFRVMG